MKSKYEISVWTDVFDSDKKRFVEEKEIVIGSDTMTSEARARNPKLINNINGTNKFSFDLYYRYVDTRTGEEVENPYIPYLVNERKIKVLWKGEWYDLLIKSIKEDQAKRVFSYSCEDSYITELSRSGFELEFATELENNIDTAPGLIEKVIENTDWRFDNTSDKIYQLTEEPVYEAELKSTLSDVEKCPEGTGTLQSKRSILLYYSFAPSINDLENDIQVYYTDDSEFKSNVNEMLVTNGDCYNLSVTWTTEGNKATAWSGSSELFEIDFSEGAGLSNRYRAERYVDSQQMEYNDIVGRYVYLYKDSEDKIICGYSTTEYDDALSVVNLVTNPSNFKNLSGWTTNDDAFVFRIYPAFDGSTQIDSYVAYSYLKLTNNKYYSNSGIQNNRSYIKNGFIPGERYIFRLQAFDDAGELPDLQHQILDAAKFVPEFKANGSKGTIFKYISGDKAEYTLDDGSKEYWLEYVFECETSCSYDDLLTTVESCDIKFTAKQDCWLKQVQFFPEKFGIKVTQTKDDEGNVISSTEEEVRINPDQMAVQSVAQVHWKYFYKDQKEGTTADSLEFIETTLTPSDKYTPLTNDYLSYAMIEESQSNRFNILQSIAEKFKCWVRFRVEHDPETGAILYDDEGPLKFVGVKAEIGEETGIGFIYGIDLKGVTRDIKSDKISTKTIVLQNENEFGKNGFCTIARSQYNYPKENTIYNFDYYIQQGLLQRSIVQKDLYGEPDEGSGNLGYYQTLHELNSEYETNLDEYINKKTELTRQEATQTVYKQYLTASEEEQTSIKDTIIKLAGASGNDAWEDAKKYASTHARDTKVQSLVDDYYIVSENIKTYQGLYDSITVSVDLLKQTIDKLVKEQNEIIDNLRAINKKFYSRYARYIQEGTWSSEDYWDDDLYYLDAIQVAYESSRPQISYVIDVMRLSELDDYSSKVFRLGDISFVQDIKYFGYLEDKITPYKEKVVLTEITSNFDTPDKDTIKVQNYLNQFDDLFQRITAATQNLEFSEGKYARAANLVADDGTIKASIIQETFASNQDLIYGAQNESVTMDNTGVTVSDNADASHLLKITSGGVFVSNDGGQTWKNAVRGDGINTELLTAGRINTENITIYDADHPSFRWDSTGINAYGEIEKIETESDENTETNDSITVDTQKMVRFDRFGVYGLKSKSLTFTPTNLQDIYDNANFGMTWDRFFMKSSNGESGKDYREINISTQDGIIVRQGDSSTTAAVRIKIGQIGDSYKNYGIEVKNSGGQIVFKSDDSGAEIAGWELGRDEDGNGYLKSEIASTNQYILIKADGSIGSYGGETQEYKESAYEITTGNYKANATIVGGTDLKEVDTQSNLYVFTSVVDNLVVTYREQSEAEDPARKEGPPDAYLPKIKSTVQFVFANDSKQTNYVLQDVYPAIQLIEYGASSVTDPDSGLPFMEYSYAYEYDVYTDEAKTKLLFKVIPSTLITEGNHTATPIKTDVNKYIPAGDTEWYIDSTGNAVFHNINADGGKIAGWLIAPDKIYQTYDGTPDGKIKTQLSATGVTGSDGNLYSIITDAVNAAMATLGGVILSNGLVNGYNIAKIAKLAQEAKSKADSALTKSKADTYYAKASHKHYVKAANVRVMGAGGSPTEIGAWGTSGNKETTGPH